MSFAKQILDNIKLQRKYWGWVEFVKETHSHKAK